MHTHEHARVRSLITAIKIDLESYYYSLNTVPPFYGRAIRDNPQEEFAQFFGPEKHLR